MQMAVQEIKELKADRLDSQVKAVLEPLETDMKDRRPKHRATTTPT